MNNTFSFKRFALYARKHYWENKMLYLITLIAFSVITLVILTKFGVFSEIVENEHAGVYKGYEKAAEGLYPFIGLIVITIFLNITAFGGKKEDYSSRSIMLPISYQERYLFVIFNIAIVAPIVFSLLYYALTSYVETLYYFGDGIRVFEGLLPLGYTLPEGVRLEDLKQVELFSFTKFFMLDDPQNFAFCQNHFHYKFSAFYFISVMLWSSFSFTRFKYSTVIVILAHILLGYGITRAFVYIVRLDEVLYHDGLQVICDQMFLPSYFTIVLILPLTYFVVAWLKLKKIEFHK